MSRRVFPAVVICIAVAAVAWIVVASMNSNNTSSDHAAGGSLASLSTSSAPWNPEYTHLNDRLQTIHMPLLTAEGTAQHIHAHLDIFVHGRQVVVPADIGVPPSGGITSLHTHDATGIIHIESPDAHALYTLGQFFDVWGVKLSQSNIGGYANTATDTLSVYDNGELVGDPTKLILAAHHEIVITYGTDAEKSAQTISTTYAFPQDL